MKTMTCVCPECKWEIGAFDISYGFSGKCSGCGIKLKVKRDKGFWLRSAILIAVVSILSAAVLKIIQFLPMSLDSQKLAKIFITPVSFTIGVFVGSRFNILEKDPKFDKDDTPH